jgi:hypothetical protein
MFSCRRMQLKAVQKTLGYLACVGGSRVCRLNEKICNRKLCIVNSCVCVSLAHTHGGLPRWCSRLIGERFHIYCNTFTNLTSLCCDDISVGGGGPVLEGGERLTICQVHHYFVFEVTSWKWFLFWKFCQLHENLDASWMPGRQEFALFVKSGCSLY